MHVLIVGAGCTGLLVAQGLRKRGINATVFERASIDRKPRDWTMMVHWGADFIKDLLPDEIYEHLKDAVTDPHVEVKAGDNERPVWNGKTGEPHCWIRSTVFTRYSRRRLCQLLSRDVNVRYEKELADIRLKNEGGVGAIFADGSIASGDILLGTDSANSRVRSWLFDDAPFAKATDMPIVVYNFPAKYPHNPDLARRIRDHPHTLMKVSTHPDHLTWYIIMLLEIPDLNRPEEWAFQHFLTHWSEDAPPDRDSGERLKHFKAMGETYAEPFRSAAAEVDDATFVPFDRLKYWAEPRLWDNRDGRVTLAGDAAHPFPPHRGQGLNNAIQDAANFVNAVETMAQTGSREALAAYDAEVFERGKREIATSVQQAYDATHMSQFASSTVVTHGHKPLPQ